MVKCITFYYFFIHVAGLNYSNCVLFRTNGIVYFFFLLISFRYRNDDCVEGGESVLLDMFAVAEELRVRHPHHFETLTHVAATFQKVHYDR